MSRGQTIGYTRVSTSDQNSSRQLDGILLDRVFEDRLSGKDINRPALTEMISFVRDGDTVLVHSIDRLARNLIDLRDLIARLNAKGVTVSFLKESLTFSSDGSNPVNVLMLSMIGAFAEFERSMILERQREGIAQAKAEGRFTGRPASLSRSHVAQIKARVSQGESKSALALEFGVSRATVYNAIKVAG